MVYAIALRRLGNHSEAQELCQEVLVKAMQKIEQLKVPAAFGGWLRSITVRMAINRQVRRAPIDRDRAAGARCHVRRVDHAARRGAGQRAGRRRSAAASRGWASSIGTRSKRFTSAASRSSQMSESFEAPIGTIKRRLHVARKRLAEQLETASAV